MTASLSDFATMSAPGSERSSAISAEASRTPLVTLRLGAAVFQDLFRETDAGRRQLGKISLRVRKNLVAGLDVKPFGVFGDDDRVALRDVVALAGFCRKDDSSRCIHLEVVDLLLALHGDNALYVVGWGSGGTMTESAVSGKRNMP